MSEWKKVKIGEIFNIEKGSLQSSKNEVGKYDFITAAADWKTHNFYDHDCEAIVYAVAASGSLGRAHYVNGKFIASDLCFILTEKDKEKYPINFQFYQLIFELIREEIVSKTKTGTSKESINQKNFSNYEIPYFSFDYQMANYEKLVNTKQKNSELLEESEKQKSYTKQLRQNILQDAIEGRLTEEWRKNNPVVKGNPDFDAEALFERIQEEKSHTDSILLTQNQEKKKKGKSLDFPNPCGNTEKPFVIPEGWKWVRLGEVCNSITDGDHLPPPKQSTGIPFVVISDISSGIINFKGDRFVSEDYFTKLPLEKIPLKDDILYTVTGSYGIPVFVTDFQFCVQRHIGIIKPKLYLKDFIYYCLMSPICKKQADFVAWGVAVKTVPIKELRKFIIPLPPLAEQEEIVRVVEAQLAKVDQLEEQITERETLTKRLMQSIMKDAFREE